MTEALEPEAPQSELLATPRLPVHLVDSDQTLSDFLTELDKVTEPIAIDAERASGFRYGQRAYLLQIAIREKAIYLVDPVAGYSEQLWLRFIARVGETPWIIHAASQDLPCLTEMQIKPSKILDTELAARLLGLPRVALGTLTEHYLQLRLAKEHSAVDWSERPLPANWLNYAALDVDVLFNLWDAVEKDLVEKNKFQIAAAEFEFLLQPSTKVQKIDKWRSMSGLHDVKDQRSLTIAKHLWLAREELAIAKDIAPGRLIPDASIVAAVKANPRSRSELASLRSFAGRASRTFIDTWWAAIEEGNSTKNVVELKLKAAGIPNHRNWPQKFPLAHARLQASKEFLNNLSTEEQIPQENILNPELLRQICFEPPQSLTVESVSEALAQRGVRLWQINLLASGLSDTLAVQEVKISEPELDSLS